jgi:hypothetical protein
LLRRDAYAYTATMTRRGFTVANGEISSARIVTDRLAAEAPDE